jgi:threonylcarbamoyladenosine tRNA methylthiotransferase MtaB
LNLEISYLHVFTYSERDNTEAANMNDNIPKNIRNKRSKMLRSLSEKKKRIFYNSQLNKIRTILFETENKFGYIHGYTDNYIKVRHPWSPGLSNKIIYAKLSKIDNEGFVRVKDLDKKNEKNKEYLYSNSNW